MTQNELNVDEIKEIIRGVDRCLKQLHRLEREAFDESGFNENANTPQNDPEALREALSILADETVHATRLTVSELTEARLRLGAIAKILDEGFGR